MRLLRDVVRFIGRILRALRRKLPSALMMLLMLMSVPLVAQDEGIPPERVPITPENIAQLEPLVVVQTPLRGVASMVFSPDHRFLFFGGPGGVFAMALDDPQNSALIENNPFLLQGGIAFSEDGALLATANVDTIRIWDMASGQILHTLETDYPAGTMQFSPDGRVLAVVGNGFAPNTLIEASEVYLWDVESGEQYGAVGYRYSWLERDGSIGFRFSPDGDALWTVVGPYVHAWDYRDPATARDPLVLTREQYFERLATFRHTPESSTVYDWTAFADEGGEYAVWLNGEFGASFFVTQSGESQAVVNGESGNDHDADGIPQSLDGYTRLERAELSRALAILEDTRFLLDGAEVRLVNRREAAVSMPRFTYDDAAGTLIDEMTGVVYFAEDDGIAGRFVTISGEPLPTFRAHYLVSDLPPAEKVVLLETSRFTFSPDGAILAMVNSDEEGQAYVDFMTLETGATSRFEVESIFVDRLVFSPSGELALVYINQMYEIVDVATGELLTPFESYGNAVFSPDGTLIVTNAFGELTFWGVADE